MPDKLQRAVRRIESYLSDFGSTLGLEQAVDAVLEAKDEDAMDCVVELMRVEPMPDHLETFWDLVADDSAPVGVRVDCLRAITGVLLNAQEDLEDADFGLTEDEELLMAPSTVEEHQARLLRTYRNADRPDPVRRYALEMAANLSQSEEVVAAGQAAVASGDADWITSGLMVLALTGAPGARQSIVRSLDHAEQKVRIEAIRCLGFLEGPGDVDMLAKLVLRRTGEERTAALEALTEIADPDVGQALLDCAERLEGAARSEAEAAYEVWLDQWAGATDGFDEVFDDDDLDDDDLDDDFDDDDF